MNAFTRTVIEDPDHPGQLIIELGQEICDQLGWQPGDSLTWMDNQDGTWTLKKISTPSL